MLENKKLVDVHYSRIIASWTQVYPGHVYFGDTFEDWLRDLGASDQQVRDIVEMATMGRLELEVDAERFIAEAKTNKRGDFEFDD